MIMKRTRPIAVFSMRTTANRLLISRSTCRSCSCSSSSTTTTGSSNGGGTRRKFSTPSSTNTGGGNNIRINAIRRMFEIIENTFGTNNSSSGTTSNLLPMDTIGSKQCEIIVLDKYITNDSLERLFSHNALAIHVKNFYGCSTSCSILANSLVQESLYNSRNWSISPINNNTNNDTTDTNTNNDTSNNKRTLESSDVLTVGEHVPYNVAILQQQQNQQQSIDNYFLGVQNELRKRRYTPKVGTDTDEEEGEGNYNNKKQQQQQPFLWPLDLLRLQLDENWYGGAGLATVNDTSNSTTSTRSVKKFGGGLTRIMKWPVRWSKGYIHVDELGPLNINYGLFSANIYLQIPNSSTSTSSQQQVIHVPVPLPVPTLDIWPLSIRSKWEWYKYAITLSGLVSYQDPVVQSTLRAKLGQSISIHTVPGDLVLFCVQRPHAAIGLPTNTNFTTNTTINDMSDDSISITNASDSDNGTTSNSHRVSLQCFIQHTGRDNRLLIDC